MADTRYSDEKKLLDTARDILGTGASPEVMSAVREGIVTLPPERQYFRVGEFALLVFGGFLFLIAGFYLPQLTRLKLPGLQLDKSASERVEPIRSLGINK
jgi:hypothetical protein